MHSVNITPNQHMEVTMKTFTYRKLPVLPIFFYIFGFFFFQIVIPKS
jgi:hypothetical protein